MEKNNVDPITVGFTVDENYVQHLSVTILSILHNKKAEDHIHFVVVGDGLSGESISVLTQITQNKNASIIFPEVRFDPFDTIMNNEAFPPHVSRAALGRLFLADIFKGDKLLYIDCDIIVRDDLSALWNIDIADFYGGAVIDPAINYSSYYANLKVNLGMSQEDPYFNAGVLLLNLKKCRQDNVMSNAIKFMVEYPDKILFGEQDGLNFAMSNNFLNMPPRWNVQSFMFNIFYSGDLRRKHSPEIVEAVKDPAIVHFTSKDKPWHYQCENPYVGEYYKYLAQTPWKGKNPYGWTFRGMIRKNRRLLKRRLKSTILGYKV